MPVSVFDAAQYVLSKTGTITTMRLQKLLYYCQAWSLVWDDSPLFDERIEAWVDGPVVPLLFDHHRGQYEAEITLGNPAILNKDQQETIDAVLNHYGTKPTKWLIDLTHLEEPWILARNGLTPLERGNSEITIDSMASYYGGL